MNLRYCFRLFFSQIKRQQILNSSYQELAALISRKYSNKEYKNPNMICLHQIQQQFKVISPGDWVLDLGSGPHFYWTDLALKLAENQSQTHRVFSNDKIEISKTRTNQQYIKGDFSLQQVQTNIALKLENRKLNTILVDVSPEFTGEINQDGLQLNKIVYEAMYFSNNFLQKGGNFVCKVLNCESSSILQETARIFFHQFFVFRPSVLRQKSPVQFFVMKGFAMNYQVEAMKQFLTRYRGSAKHKTEIVQDYQGKYKWDPIQILRNKAKNDILGLKMQGRTDRDIENMFAGDPFIRIGQILKQVKQIDKAKIDGDQILIKKALNKYTEGKLFSQVTQVPTNRQQWINFLQKMQIQLKELRKKSKKVPQRNTQNLQPLRDNQVYMKDDTKTADQQKTYLYIEDDLLGNYEQDYEDEYVNQQLAKLRSNNPEMQQKYQKYRKTNQKVKLDEVFDMDKMAARESEFEKEIADVGEAIRVMSDEEFKQILEKQEGYEEQLQKNVGKSSKGSRNKFRNK